MAASNVREMCVYFAKLAERAERYDEMASAMKKVACLDTELTVEERNLFSVSFKNLTGSRRASWRVLTSLHREEDAKGHEQKVNIIKELMQKVESELSKICNDIMTVIDEHLIPSSSSTESTVFFYKLKGDYNRYLAEFKTGNDKAKVAHEAMEAYQAATNAVGSDLALTHPVRLGLALNFSVFYYEIMNSPERALQLAKKAVDEATPEFDRLGEELPYKDSTYLMGLLKENLTVWTEDIDEGLRKLMGL